MERKDVNGEKERKTFEAHDRIDSSVIRLTAFLTTVHAKLKALIF
jgi:hypothetical protein